ncbi:Phosphomannomutase 2 [Schistosoma japonicum]|nr:Phosphomannomutase 2 [Schistosoma japonicum]
MFKMFRILEMSYILRGFRIRFDVTIVVSKDLQELIDLENLGSNQSLCSFIMSKKVICLFDVDGTLTKPRNTITDHMLQFLIKLSSYVPLAVVSGSDFQKVSSQISPSAAEKFPFIFSENGLVVHSYGEKISSTNIVEHVGEDILQRLINFCLQYMSNLWLPRKRGNFIEFRDGLINICPVGRSCTQEERDEFADYDAKHKIRENFVAKMRSEFHSSPLQFAIGGQISIDVFPKGWDKRYCLNFLKDYDTIHFFGDKTEETAKDWVILKKSAESRITLKTEIQNEC